MGRGQASLGRTRQGRHTSVWRGRPGCRLQSAQTLGERGDPTSGALRQEVTCSVGTRRNSAGGTPPSRKQCGNTWGEDTHMYAFGEEPQTRQNQGTRASQHPSSGEGPSMAFTELGSQGLVTHRSGTLRTSVSRNVGCAHTRLRVITSERVCTGVKGRTSCVMLHAYTHGEALALCRLLPRPRSACPHGRQPRARHSLQGSEPPARVGTRRWPSPVLWPLLCSLAASSAPHLSSSEQVARARCHPTQA